jgi:hypothetical protein
MGMRRTFVNIGRQLQEKRKLSQKESFVSKIKIPRGLFALLFLAAAGAGLFFWTRSRPDDFDRKIPVSPEDSKAAAQSAKTIYETFKSGGSKDIASLTRMDDESLECASELLSKLSGPDFGKASVFAPPYDSAEIHVLVPSKDKREFCFLMRKDKDGFKLCSAGWAAQ